MEAAVSNVTNAATKPKRSKSDLESVERLMTSNEVAEMIRIKPGTLRLWRSQQIKDQPVFIKRNGLVLYRKRDVEEWLAKGAVKY